MNIATNPQSVVHTSTPDASSSSPPLVIFVLGPPCAGKSTICTILAKRFKLDHFSLGDELRNLVSSNFTGHPARIKSKLSVDELQDLTKGVRAGTLAPSNITPKYVRERIFPDGVVPPNVRILIDGFPRGVDRWETFKDSVKDIWECGDNTWVLVLCTDREVAKERFVSRGRAGDVFDKRFDSHEESIGDIVAAMKQDGVNVMECQTGLGFHPEDIVEVVKMIPGLAEGGGHQ
jgi:UMP-CMP kinase